MITEIQLAADHSTPDAVMTTVRKQGFRLANIHNCFDAGMDGGLIADDYQLGVGQWYRHWMGPIVTKGPFPKGTRVAVLPLG